MATKSDPANDYTISLERANWVSLLLFIPLSAVFIIPYGLFWGAAMPGIALGLLSFDIDFLREMPGLPCLAFSF